MTATPAPFSSKDNASGTLASTASAVATSIVLTAADGAKFPQPYAGTCSSLGSSTTLNSTGILAIIGSGAVGKLIWNATDGSVAVITAVNTNSLTTTRLLGGTNNTWNNSDAWRIDAFVATLVKISTSSYGVQSDGQREEVLITARSTDTLTAATRGYNGTSAAQFDPGDYVQLRMTSPAAERLKDIISVLQQQVDTNVTNISNLQTGAYFYVTTTGSANAYVAATPALTALAAGNIVMFNANFQNSGSATLNLNGLGAKTIKKLGGGTNLVSGDIIVGQLVIVQYDGTNFQMLSPTAANFVSTDYDKGITIITSSSSSIGASSTSELALGSGTSITAAQWAAGVVLKVFMAGTQTWAAGSLTVRLRLSGLSGTELGLWQVTPVSTGEKWNFVAYITCRATGVSGSLLCNGMLTLGTSSNLKIDNGTSSVGSAQTIDISGTTTLQPTITFGSSNGTNGMVLTTFVVESLSTTAS